MYFLKYAVVVLLVAVVGLTGCNDGISIEQEIGSEGGALVLGDATLLISAAALPSTVIVKFIEGASGAEVEIAENETPVSSIYSLANDQGNALPSEDAPFRLTLPFDVEALGKVLPTQAQVYVKMDTGEEIYRLTGTLTDNHIEILLYGLHPDADFQVVYNPNCVFILEEEIEDEKILTPTSWETTNWKIHIDLRSAEVREAVAVALGAANAANVTDEQVVAVVRDRILRNAREVAALYSAMPLRRPNIEIQTRIDGSKRMVLIVAGQRSYYENPTLEDGVGQIHIGCKTIGWNVESPLGTARNVIAHELFHACVNGHNLKQGIGYYRGYNEGMATVIGHTVDNGNVVSVRHNSPDRNYTMMLNRPLGLHDPRKESYTNQDFFAYVGKRYGGGSMNYIAGTATDADGYRNGVLEQARKYLTGDTALHRWNSPLEDYLQAYRICLHNTFMLQFGKSLAEVYWDFAKNRAYEGNPESVLLTEDSPQRWSLRTGFFETDGIYGHSFTSADENVELSYTSISTLNSIEPFSTRALIFSAGGFDADLVLDFDTMGWFEDAYGNCVKVKVYKTGDDGTELTASDGGITLSHFGDTFDQVIVLISNVSVDGPISISLNARTQANTTPEPESCSPLLYNVSKTRWHMYWDYYCDGTIDDDILWQFNPDGTISELLIVVYGYSWTVVDNAIIIVSEFGRMEAAFSGDCTRMENGVTDNMFAHDTCWTAERFDNPQ